MAAALRNFWLEFNIGGRKTLLNGGPKIKKGGFFGEIKIRENGEVSDAKLNISGFCDEEGNLTITAFNSEDPSKVITIEKSR